MSEENNYPSQEAIRNARHEGFKDSVSHMPQDKMQRMANAYVPQDQRREANVSGFYNAVQGNG